MTKLFVVALAIFGFAGTSHANWDAKAQNALEMQVAQQNAVYDFVQYVNEQTDQDLKVNDYTSEVKLVSATSKDGLDSLPATFEVTLHARDKDGNVSNDSVGAEMFCVRGRTIQESRFTRVTPIHCSVVR